MASNVIPLPGAAGNSDALAELAVMEIVRRMARAEKIEAAALELVAVVRERKQAGWHKVPMAELEALAQALEDGR